MRGLLAVLAVVLTGVVLPHPATAGALARTLTIVEDGPLTRLIIGLDRDVTATVSTHADPPMVIVESPDLTFRLPRDAAGGRGDLAGGIVTAWRAETRHADAGRTNTGVTAAARLILEVAVPAHVLKAEVQVREGRAGAELVIELVPEPNNGPLPASTETVPPIAGTSVASGALRSGRYETGPPPRSQFGRPIVVIDPGHGGTDPGTVGAGGVLEKDVVLAVAQGLRKALLASGRYDVAMTRAGDNFVSLDARVDLAETIGADLFISLHADAVEDRAMAGSIRGASVYVLSARASDEEARRLAERENSADARDDAEARQAQGANDVRGILADLLRREREDFSTRARSAVVEELGRRIALNSKPARAAAFRVLRQPRTPAVLVELGYMSNHGDQQLMTRADWQQKVAVGLAAAIDRFFSAHHHYRR